MSGSRPLPGAFVVIEGVDGCGSTTQSKLLVDALERRGIAALHTYEPSAGPVGALIRQVLQKKLVGAEGAPRSFSFATMALLFAADRADHLEHGVLPALRAGRVVVSDRYDLSSLAYQSATAPGGEPVLPWIRALNSRVMRPDLTLVLDVPAELAERRRRERGGAEELFEVRELQEKLVRLYRSASELVPGDRLMHVPGHGDIAEVAERVLDATRSALPDVFAAAGAEV